MDEKIKQYVKQGGIFAELYFDFHLIKNIDKDKLIDVATGFSTDLINSLVDKEWIYFGVAEIEPPIEDENGISTYAKLTILFRNFRTMLLTIAEFNPVGIEILAPETVELDVGSLQEALNDLSKLIYETKFNMLTKEKQRELLKAYKLRESIGKRVRERVLKRD